MTFEDAVSNHFGRPVSGTALDLIVTRMKQFGLSTPSETLAARAVSELVTEGKLRVPSSKSPSAPSGPLTKVEIEQFMSMHPREVAERYWSDAAFQPRYDIAIRDLGFKAPQEQEKPIDVPPERDPWAKLTAQDYYKFSAADVIRMFRSDPLFKRAVNRLIEHGEI